MKYCVSFEVWTESKNIILTIFGFKDAICLLSILAWWQYAIVYLPMFDKNLMPP
jgi:hypothetical protein